jgi:aspartate/glutamate racemase
MQDLSNRTVGIIHAALITCKAVQPYLDSILPDVKVVHHVDDTIQNSNFACEPGIIPKQNLYKFATYAHYLELAGVDVILLACSTFNRAVEVARPMINTPMLQIDRPMMDLAVQQGQRIGLLATVPTTVPASTRLLELAAADAGKKIDITTVLCSEAFAEIKKGNTAKHNELLLQEIDQLSKNVDAIVLAQLSMSALEPELINPRVPIFNSGRTGFTRVREILEAM